MYIVAIAWLYVVLMMSLTEQSWIAGIGTFILYGVAPLSLFSGSRAHRLASGAARSRSGKRPGNPRTATRTAATARPDARLAHASRMPRPHQAARQISVAMRPVVRSRR